MRTLLLAAFFATGSAAAHAQSATPSRTGIYAELGGHGGIYSLGVDRQLAGGPAGEAFLRVGASVLPDLFGDGLFVTIPATFGAAVTVADLSIASANLPIGIEGGVGVTGVYLSKPSSFLGSEVPPALQALPTASAALRIGIPRGRGSLRLGVTGFLDLDRSADNPAFSALPSLGVTVLR